jgi:hypothetical protein
MMAQADSYVRDSASIQRWPIDINTNRGIATCLPSDLLAQFSPVMI